MRKAFFLLLLALAFVPAAEAQLYYNIILLSPVEDSIHYLGDRIEFRIEVSEAGKSVSNASVTASLPNGAVLALSESGGAYISNYTLKWDDPPGKWIIKLKAEKNVGEIYRGERNISINIKPAALLVQILSPNEYRISEEDVEIKVNASYPDGSPFRGSVTASTPYKEEVMGYRNSLYYYSFPARDGFWTLKVNASDGKNSGYAERVFLISRRSVLDSIMEYWYILAIPPAAIFLVLFLIRFPDIMLARLKKKERETKEMLIGTQEKYFREKTMGWKNFSELQAKYKAQYESVKSDIAELEKTDRRLRGYLYRKIRGFGKK